MGVSVAEAAAIQTEQLTKDYAGSEALSRFGALRRLPGNWLPEARPPVRALDSLNLTVARGEIFGFLGPNGAGKTTTIRLLLDLIRPTQGRASVLGLDAQRDSVAAHRRIGFLPAELNLWKKPAGGSHPALPGRRARQSGSDACGSGAAGGTAGAGPISPHPHFNPAAIGASSAWSSP